MSFKKIRLISATALILCALLFTVKPSFALSVNQAAPPIALRDSSGKYFYLSDYTGSSAKKPAKGVIVNFFASTCDPCKKELPALNSLVDEFARDNIKVVIIGYKEGFDEFMGMLENLKVEKPVILSDPYGKAGKEYGVYGLPMTIFIGADGKVKEIVRGELTGRALKEKAAKFFK
ncbi:MAG: TlpA family protein disulfide reductase [Proteobacteria bacterium]|nr:TlpA family protein disulfide reductase [Pseudomonadota bacterium]